MRRIFMSLVAALAIAIAIPGVALAAHRHRGPHAHHARHGRHHGKHARLRRHRKHHGHHKHHAKRSRYIRFAPMAPTTGEGVETPEEGVTGTEGEASGPETAGEVVSFEGEALTIKLPDGTVVKGKVTEDTRLLCMSEEAAQSDEADETDEPDHSSGDGSGDHQGAEEGAEGSEGEGAKEGEQGDSSQPSAHDSSFDGSGDGSQYGDGQPWPGYGHSWSRDAHGSASCETTALTPGAMVREAELRLGSAGAVWEKVVLLQ